MMRVGFSMHSSGVSGEAVAGVHLNHLHMTRWLFCDAYRETNGSMCQDHTTMPLLWCP